MPEGTTGAVAEVVTSPSTPAPSSPVVPSSPVSPVTTADTSKPAPSFTEAWSAAESATADPVPETPPAEKAAPAPIAPAAPETPETVVVATPEKTKDGPIPLDAHKRVIDNTRKKTAEETETRFRTEHKSSLEFGELFDRDPVSTATKLVTNLVRHPELGPKFAAELSKVFQTPAPEPQIEAQWAAPDGSPVYTAADVAKLIDKAKREITADVRSQLVDPLTQRVEPLLTREQAREHTERLTAHEAQAKASMGELFDTFKDKPYFNDHKAEIGKQTIALIGEGKSPQLAIALAYTEAVLTKGVADRQQQLDRAAIAKSLGSTSQPGSVTSAAAERPKSFHEAFAGLDLG